jgi:hypothetical protein
VCDPSKVTCKSLPPTCPAGEVPSVDVLTACWSQCVPLTQCGCDGSACTSQCPGKDAVCYVSQHRCGLLP